MFLQPGVGHDFSCLYLTGRMFACAWEPLLQSYILSVRALIHVATVNFRSTAPCMGEPACAWSCGWRLVPLHTTSYTLSWSLQLVSHSFSFSSARHSRAVNRTTSVRLAMDASWCITCHYEACTTHAALLVTVEFVFKICHLGHAPADVPEQYIQFVNAM